MPQHTKSERAKNKPSERSRGNALTRALRDIFGFGVGEGGKALERAEGIFSRTAKKIEKDTGTLRRRSRR